LIENATAPTAVGLYVKGFAEVGFSVVGFDEIGFSDVGFNDVGFSDVGFNDVGFSDIGCREVGFSDGFAEVAWIDGATLVNFDVGFRVVEVVGLYVAGINV